MNSSVILPVLTVMLSVLLVIQRNRVAKAKASKKHRRVVLDVSHLVKSSDLRKRDAEAAADRERYYATEK